MAIIKKPTEQESNVAALLEAAGFIAVTIGAGAQTRDSGKWECDAWRVTIETAPGNGAVRSETFDYFTGVGHRVAPSPRAFDNVRTPRDRARWERENAKPVAPHVAGVLYSIVRDGDALNTNFSDWCAELDMSDDSMKALETYKACCDNARRLKTLIGSYAYTKIADALQDY